MGRKTEKSQKGKLSAYTFVHSERKQGLNSTTLFDLIDYIAVKHKALSSRA